MTSEVAKVRASAERRRDVPAEQDSDGERVCRAGASAKTSAKPNGDAPPPGPTFVRVVLTMTTDQYAILEAAERRVRGKVRKRLREQTLQSFVHGFDPKSPDYLYWGSVESRQPLVDAAYIAQALLTASETLWRPLDEVTKGRVIHEFQMIRQIKPFNNN